MARRLKKQVIYISESNLVQAVEEFCHSRGLLAKDDAVIELREYDEDEELYAFLVVKDNNEED